MTRTAMRLGAHIGDRLRLLAQIVGHNVLLNRLRLAARQARMRRPCRRLRGLRFAACAVALVALSAALLDAAVVGAVSHIPKSIEHAAWRMTDIGKSGWVLFPTALVLLVAVSVRWGRSLCRHRLSAANWVTLSAYVFFAVGASGLIATVLKRLIGRARPVLFEAHGAFEFAPIAVEATFASFPSGHATTVGALCAIVALMSPRLMPAAIIAGIGLGLTRVLVGAHYLSDVVAGLAFGAWFSYFAARLFARYGLVFTLDDSGWPVRRRYFYLIAGHGKAVTALLPRGIGSARV